MKKPKLHEISQKLILSAKILILGHRSDLFTHFGKILEKPLERFVRKVKKTLKMQKK